MVVLQLAQRLRRVRCRLGGAAGPGNGTQQRQRRDQRKRRQASVQTHKQQFSSRLGGILTTRPKRSAAPYNAAASPAAAATA
jgi:hypothetical protein